MALGGQQGVEEELAVFAAGVTVTDAGVGGDEVVVVDVGLAGEDAVVEAEEADDPVGDRPHRHQRADGQVPGAEVGPRRVAPQPVGEQRADLGQGQLRPAGRTGRRLGLPASALPASATTSSRRWRSSAVCQASSELVAVSMAAASARAAAQAAIGWGPVRRSRAAVEAVEELGQPAGEIDVAAAHVVERQDAADQALPLVGHGHAEQHPVEARPPGVGVEGVELVRRPVGGVEAPADAGGGHPFLGPGEVVVVEAEPPPDRLPAGQVEHLGGGHPGRRQVQQLGHHAQHRVGLAQRPVGQADPEIDAGRPGGRPRTAEVSASPRRRALRRPRRWRGSAGRRPRCRGTSR